MPRRPRLAVAGIPWHIIQRGNNHSACFYAEQDYQYYLQTLREQAEKYQCAIHAYVLMTNHVHLLLTPAKTESASLLMKHLGQRFVQYINRSYRRSGTLWEGRFKSCLAQEEDYVLVCYRYIELNPVRAGMVQHPGEYPWSSYRYNGDGKENSLLKPHDHYLGLGVDQRERCANYRSLFKAHLDSSTINEIRKATNGNYVLGNDRFKDEIEDRLQRRVTPGKSGRPAKKNEPK
ncbi:MAG: transposase [Gammaproteobacteria bacterium]|nr:transposase [Gammaproteobacteria bacterium]